MPNEFVARNGIIALNNSVITGSLTVTNGITGSLQGTASFATTASNVLGGATNYIPLWNGATSLSSSVLYQSSGNIGIGTTSPYIYSTWTFATLNGNGGSGIVFRNNNVDTTQLYGFSGGTDLLSTGYFQLYTGGSVRMFVSSTGNVGVGTTSPSYTLDVSGSIRSTSNAYFATSAGSVGIGTTNPLGAFGINSGTGVVGFNVGSISSPTRGNLFYDTDGTGWKFSIGKYQSSTYTAQMTFQDNGNVGIGTTSPSARLHISGSTTTNLLVGTSDLFVSASGNVGVGTTTPLYRLHVRTSAVNDVAILDTTAGGGSNLLFSDGNTVTAPKIGALGDQLTFTTNNTVQARINTSGNFLLGTTNNNARLTVLASGSSDVVYFSTATAGAYIVLADGNTTASPRIGAITNNIVFNTTSSGTPVERMRIDSTGNVGIGTTSPVNTSGYGGLSINGVSGSIISMLQGSSETFRLTNAVGYTFINTTGATPLLLGTNALEYMRITSTGNVGIGTTSPSAKLTVQGTTSDQIRIYEVTDSLNYYRIGRNSTTGYLDFYGNQSGYTGYVFNGVDGERMRIDSSGNVGIGTTSPTTRLHVSASTGGVLEIDGAGTAGANALYVSASGNVGIGTATPLSRLTVYGAASTSTSQISIVNSEGGHLILRSGIPGISNNGASFVTADVDGSNQNTRMVISSTGNVGIGTTSPASTLDVRGVVEAGTGTIRTVLSYTGTGGVVGTLSNHPLIFYANNDERARITAAGNVGIGTTTPGYKLDVNGQSSGIAASFGAQISNTNFSGISFGYAEAANTSYRKSALVFERSETHGGGSNASGKIHFLLNNNGASSATALTDAVVTIDSVGTTVGSARMGIGTRFPTASLHISGSVSTDNLMRVQSTAGAEYFFISASGNVGIGTTSPTEKLTVRGNGAKILIESQTDPSGYYAYLQSNYDSANPFVLNSQGFSILGSKTGISSAAGQTTYLNSYYDLSLNTAGSTASTATSRLFISQSGNVGIGTTNPSTRLHVSASTGGVLEVDGAGTAGANALYVSASGNVGIGTTAPTERITIQSGASTSAAISFRGNNLTSADELFIGQGTAGGTFIYNRGVYDMSFGTSNATRMFISSSGNVGIGTTTPAYKLHIVGGHVKLPNNYKLYFGDVAEALGFQIGSDGASNNMVISQANNATLQIGTGGTSGHIIFTPNSVESVRFTGTGNVGIGTTSPAAKLQVNGNTLITGSLTVGQTTTGSSENTLTVGLPPAGGAGEGGQILLAASGGLYTSASMLDTYQNRFRILRGTNASSDAEFLNVVLHNGQLVLNRYTGSGAFTGTAAANLAVDSSGNVITVATGGGGGGSVTINNNVDNYLITATGTANTLNGEANLQFNGSALTITGSLTVITGSAIELQVTNTGVNIGNSFTDVHRITGSLNMPHTASGVIKIQDASVWADAANYKNPQIRLPDYQTGITLINNDEIQFVTNATAPMGLKLSAGIPKVTLDSSAWLQWSSAETNGFTHDVILKRESVGVLAITGSIKSSGGFTGSLQGTSSWAVSASWAPSAGGSAPTAVTFNRVTGSYTFALTDAGKTVEVSGSTATSHSLTIPASSSVDFADGTYIDVVLYGTGSILFVTGSGVTVRSANNWLRMGTRYGAATLINISGNEWYLIGNLNA